MVNDMTYGELIQYMADQGWEWVRVIRDGLWRPSRLTRNWDD